MSVIYVEAGLKPVVEVGLVEEEVAHWQHAICGSEPPEPHPSV